MFGQSLKLRLGAFVGITQCPSAAGLLIALLRPVSLELLWDLSYNHSQDDESVILKELEGHNNNLILPTKEVN